MAARSRNFVQIDRLLVIALFLQPSLSPNRSEDVGPLAGFGKLLVW